MTTISDPIAIDHADSDELLGVREAAEVAGVSEKTIRAWLHAGRLPAEMHDTAHGRAYRIHRGELEDAVKVIPVRAVATGDRMALQSAVEALDGAIKVLEDVPAQLSEVQEVGQAMTEQLGSGGYENTELRTAIEALRALVDERLPERKRRRWLWRKR